MSKIAVMVVEGVEEIESLTVVDYCRRAGIEVTTASLTGKKQIMGSHQIMFCTDTVAEDVDYDAMDGIVFPGGPGSFAYADMPLANELAAKFLNSGKMLAAICAAPGVLSKTGLLKGKKATVYPGCQEEGQAEWQETSTAVDGNLITGKGPGAAGLFALEIIGYLQGEEAKMQIKSSTMMP